MINTETLYITPEILSVISEIDEFKGVWRTLNEIAPDRLPSQDHVSTENIDFSVHDQKIEAGYAEMMTMIIRNHKDLSLDEVFIIRLHKDLGKYIGKDGWHGGEYKNLPNHIEVFSTDGKKLGVVLATASPSDTPFMMKELISWTNEAIKHKASHPLLITAIFIIVFLAIHPFQEGNEKLSWILTTYLLLSFGYSHVLYCSFENVLEHHKDSYSLALRQTQGTLRADRPNWQPGILAFLKILQRQKQQLELKMENESMLLHQFSELEFKILEQVKSSKRIKISDIVTLTKANRNTVKKHLVSMVNNRNLAKHGKGKGTWYTIPI